MTSSASAASPRNVLIGSFRTDGGSLHISRALVGGILATVLAALTIGLWDPTYALPLVVGSAYTGILNLEGDPAARVRGMAWAAAWLALATLVGGLVSPYVVLELGVVAVVGLIGGYAGVLGKRGAIIGVVAMSMYCVFAGLGLTPSHAVKFAALMGLGGLIQITLWTIVILVQDPRALTQRTPVESWVRRLRSGGTGDSHFLRHAIRLSIAMLIGSMIANHMSWPHPYWIPMTIAIMSKPDSHGTATRVLERIMGTLLGVGLAVFFVSLTGEGEAVIPFYAGAGVFLLLAFQSAKYAITVAGMTFTVMTMMTLLGDPILETSGLRVLMTVIAGAITALAALALWVMSRRRSGRSEPASR